MPLASRLPGFAFALVALSFPAMAQADMVVDMPVTCPRGTEKHNSHSGAYCSPPLRADCPPGYEPKVRHSTSYCEAPPPAPCPKGTYWESASPTEASCTLNDRCDNDNKCSEGQACENLSFCLEEVDMGRYSMDVSRGTCRTQADCKAFPNSECRKRLTCTNPNTRKYEAQRIAAAKDVPPEKVPKPYEATWFNGAPPKYPILKDGQKRPPLPDVPEPPDDTPLPDDTPPPVVDEPDAGFATPPTGDKPPTGEKGPTDAPVNTPKPPSGHAGCAGCIVGASDRDMAGWAALMSLLGLGIAVRRKLTMKKDEAKG